MELAWPRIGALWQKDKQDGDTTVTTFSGTVKVNGQDIPIFVRANRFAAQDREAGKNAPDWQIFQMPPKSR